MEMHTIICGTSKSKDVDEYYVKERAKFWKLIHESGVTSKELQPHEYREFTRYGYHLMELVSDIIPQDRLINFDETQRKNIEHSVDRIDNMNIKRVFFNGKKAACWFLQGKGERKVTKTCSSVTRKRSYGRQVDLDLGYDVYILPSTSGTAARYWNAEIWTQAWKDTLQDIKLDHQ